MGTWSHGNFDSDTAADHLSIMTNRLISEITEAMSDPEELGPDEYWGNAVPCNIELLNMIAARHWVGTMLPEPSVVEFWKSTYMTVWEDNIDELGPKPEFKTQRREVLQKTFDELLSHATRQQRGE